MSALKTRFAGQAAKRLRENSTDAERKLWSRLRDRRFFGFKFVRQQPVGPFIADFACREADLIVKLDGGQHSEDAAVQYDARRTAVLAEHGFSVLRFWNNDVLSNIDGVLQVIAGRLQKAPSPGLRFAKTDLSPKGEVGGQTVRHHTGGEPLITSPSGDRSDRASGPGEGAFATTGEHT